MWALKLLDIRKNVRIRAEMFFLGAFIEIYFKRTLLNVLEYMFAF